MSEPMSKKIQSFEENRILSMEMLVIPILFPSLSNQHEMKVSGSQFCLSVFLFLQTSTKDKLLSHSNLGSLPICHQPTYQLEIDIETSQPILLGSFFTSDNTDF